MTTIAPERTPVDDTVGRQPVEVVEVVGGVDTHKDTHTAAVIDSAGRLLGSRTFAATGIGVPLAALHRLNSAPEQLERALAGLLGDGLAELHQGGYRLPA